MATLFENELVLPGVITEILPSYSEGYDTSLFGTTESMVIIGTAFNGPVGRAVTVYSPEHAKYVFGDSFDAKTRKEATLVPEIYNAWERGCRTIYAVRISGKDMFKDFDLAIESKLKLRVSSLFPSNENKDCFFVYEATQGAEGDAGTFKIYKPSSKATITEKMQGIVDGSDSILVNSINLESYSIDKTNKLSDAIRIFNESTVNNGLRLSIVNEDGADVTDTDKEAHGISVGAMFPGLYTIARDKNNAIAVTDVEYVKNASFGLYRGFEGAVWKKLVLNTNVNASLPVFGVNKTEFKNKLSGNDVTIDDNFEWVKVPGAVNKIFGKDAVDYEEVELNSFDLYKKLGSGFAKTAKVQPIEREGKETFYKVIETPRGDENRVVAIEDGIYSLLENYGTDYRVLTCANAETKISARLPKKDEFKVAVPKTIDIVSAQTSEPVIKATPVLAETDFTMPRAYDITVGEEGAQELDLNAIIAGLSSKKYKRVPAITEAEMTPEVTNDSTLEDGQLAVVVKAGAEAIPPSSEGDTEVQQVKRVKAYNKAAEATYKLARFNKKAKAFEYVEVTYFSSTELGEIKDRFLITEGNTTKLVPLYVKDAVEVDGTYALVKEAITEESYVVVESGVTNIAKISAECVEPIAALHSVLGHEEGNDYTMAYVDSVPVISKEHANKSIVKVISNKLEWCSFGDLVEDLNADSDLAKFFKFSLVDIEDSVKDVEIGVTGSGEDRLAPTYDSNKYIPYTTQDNFARQLAQHAMYTSLKTFPTHGIIGCEKLTGVTLNAVANRVNEILAMNLDLYAKKANGNNMLDKDNMPYPIGRCLSVTFMQYTVTTGNGYNFISNGAAGYAGMVSTLPAGRSSTNQPINLSGLSFELSQYQLGKLAANGIVVCKNSNRGTVIADGVTKAPVDSPFVRLSTTKTMNIVDKILRAAIEPFIGLQDSLANRNSLQTSVKSELNKLLDNILRAYDFKISSDSNSQRLGVIYVDYVIAPTNEIREVRNRVTVK